VSKQPKRPDLQALIAGNSAVALEPEVSAPEPAAPPVPAPAVVQLPTAGKPARLAPKMAAPEPQTGQGTLKQRTTQLTMYLEGPVYDQLRELAHAERKKLHPLLREGLDLLFKNRGLKSLAQLEKGPAS
jgi:hypothetical protein